MSPTSASICWRDILSSAPRLMRSSSRWWSSTLRSVWASRWEKAPASPELTILSSSAVVALSAAEAAPPPRAGLRTCHMSALPAQGGGNAGVESVDILADAALALDVGDRHSPLRGDAHHGGVVADRVGHLSRQRLLNIRRADDFQKALFKAV